MRSFAENWRALLPYERQYQQALFALGEFEQEYHEKLGTLGISSPTHTERSTDLICEYVALKYALLTNLQHRIQEVCTHMETFVQVKQQVIEDNPEGDTQ